MEDLLVLIPALPLAAAVINFLFGRWYLKTVAAWVAIAAVGVSFLLSVAVFLEQVGDSHGTLTQELYTWIPAGSFEVPLNLHVDNLSAIMLMVVMSVSLLVHIYSVGYMHGDPGIYRFYSYLPLFVFSMLMLVLADNYLVIFFGWEAVGLSSYLLIGYYFRRKSAADAAKKAFIVNRIGDFGFGLGIMFLFMHLGTVMFEDIFANIGTLGGSTITVIALLLFTGAIGKSAQLPLFVWLPDAMEGPTPVSALIHAATMVTAGVYMVARSYPIFIASETAMLVVSIVGAVTAIIAATIAITQYDIKRVVAYSTVSQLGFMVFALGTGAWIAAIFHLMTHAFFKGLLFLGSGSVIHGMGGEQDMRKMGGLKKYMPITYWTFLIAAAANAGIFPLAGFWSKDEILVGAYLDHSYVIMTIGFIAAFFTSLYMFRAVFMTFHGKEKFNTRKVHPHESPLIMTVPLVILAVASVGAGFLGFPPEDGWLHGFLHEAFELIHAHHVSMTETLIFGVLSTVVALSGLSVAYLAYMKQSKTFSPTVWAERFPWLYSLFYNKWYFDQIYEALVVHPLWWFSENILWKIVDVKIIDGLVNGVASSTSFASGQLRRVQTGFVSNYALAIALGAVVIVGIYFVFVSNVFA
jgi:NADH-quinone oxidoreductase subunit L